MKRKTIRLASSETIVAVVPEYASSPGWANRPLWVYIRNRTGVFRAECLQPDEQTPVMDALFGPLASVHSEMRREVLQVVKWVGEREGV
jgi:hypothetical protein